MNPNEGNLLSTDSLKQGGIEKIGIVSNVVLLDSTESTNQVVHDPKYRKPGTLVVTNHQTNGKGRQNRSWVSPPGAGLAFSLVLKPSFPVPEWSLYPLIVGYCTMTAIAQIMKENQVSQQVSLKWPNDVLVGDKKVAGILCEILSSPESDPLFVAGIGINIDWRGLPMPVEFADRSRSLAECSLSKIDPVQVLHGVLSELDKQFNRENLKNREEIVAMITACCSTIGTHVVAHGTPTVTGKAVRIAQDGQLVIEQPDASTIHVSAADVEHLR